MDVDHDKQLDGTKRDLNNHFNEYGIQITSLSVTNVHLPREFANNMQEESVWGTRDEFNVLEQKFALQKIVRCIYQFTSCRISVIAMSANQRAGGQIETEGGRGLGEVHGGKGNAGG